MTEYSECLVGYSFIIRSITSSLLRAVKPEEQERNRKMLPSNITTGTAVESEFEGLVSTQSALCLSDDILFTKVELLFVGQVSPLHI